MYCIIFLWISQHCSLCYTLVQIALDTFHWNPIIHVFIWGSILIWLVAIPITNAPGLYGFLGLFEYLGVAYEVIPSATYWFYLPLVTAIALAPTIIFRVIRLETDPHIVDDVRLLQHKEGRRLFKRTKFRQKPMEAAVRQTSPERTGYAFSHTEGYGQMITTGHIFGMNENEVFEEHQRRISMIVSNPTSPASKEPGSALKASLAIGGLTVTAAVVTHGVIHNDGKQEVGVEIHNIDTLEDGKTETECGSKENEVGSKGKQSPIIEERNVKVHIDLIEEEDVESASNDETPMDNKKGEMSADDSSQQKYGSRVLLTKKDSSGSEGERETNLIEEDRVSSNNPPVSINLPGSVEEGPSSDVEEKDKNGTSDDKKVLL